uniref:Uncharacterized protein n=1 Tax=Pyramimonas obovata TaxID=1411642 RepID=A0A7S0RI58_9CHLO
MKMPPTVRFAAERSDDDSDGGPLRQSFSMEAYPNAPSFKRPPPRALVSRSCESQGSPRYSLRQTRPACRPPIWLKGSTDSPRSRVVRQQSESPLFAQNHLEDVDFEPQVLWWSPTTTPGRRLTRTETQPQQQELDRQSYDAQQYYSPRLNAYGTPRHGRRPQTTVCMPQNADWCQGTTPRKVKNASTQFL